MKYSINFSNIMQFLCRFMYCFFLCRSVYCMCANVYCGNPIAVNKYIILNTSIWRLIKICFNNILSLGLVLQSGPFFHIFPPKPGNGTIIMKLAILLKTSKLILFVWYCSGCGRCIPIDATNCSGCGGCDHTEATIFIMPLWDSDSTSMLSYSQRHYDI
jgi:hypothetical protein